MGIPVEEALRAHIADLCRAADNAGAPRFSVFLDEQAQSLAQGVLRRERGSHLFYGGFPEAARRVLGVFPDGMAARGDAFPVRAFQALAPKGYALGHRDFLGALLALGIKREVVGDILVEGEKTVFFVLPQACALVLGELRQVGRVGVRVSPAPLGEIHCAQRFEESDRTLSSLRLDGVAAALADLSRAQAARMVEAGLVAINGIPCGKITRLVADGDRVSIRGKGKYVVGFDGRTTRKGRLVIHCKKYL